MYLVSFWGQGTSCSPGSSGAADGVEAGDHALFVAVDFRVDGGADAGHDAHVDDGVGGVGKLDTDLRHGRADGAHGEGHDVHGAAAHGAAKERLSFLRMTKGSSQLLVGPAVRLSRGSR